MGRRLELTGKVFWRLTVVKFDSIYAKGVKRLSKWLCRCACGKECLVLWGDLTSWNTNSCWCYMVDRIKETNSTHKMSKTPLYGVYASIRQRCADVNCKSYPDYGWRGIACERSSYEDFEKDMWDWYKRWLTIDRINNDGNYCKENCRRVDRFVQNNNTRRNTFLEYDWLRLTISQRARKIWVKRNTLSARLYNSKRPVEKILTTP